MRAAIAGARIAKRCAGLREGVIDLVATDQLACPPA